MPYAIRSHWYHTLQQALSSLLFSGLGSSCLNKDYTDKHSQVLEFMMKVSEQRLTYCFTDPLSTQLCTSITVAPSSAVVISYHEEISVWCSTAAMHLKQIQYIQSTVQNDVMLMLRKLCEIKPIQTFFHILQKKTKCIISPSISLSFVSPDRSTSWIVSNSMDCMLHRHDLERKFLNEGS